MALSHIFALVALFLALAAVLLARPALSAWGVIVLAILHLLREVIL